jgi:hypothetical protein
LLGWFVAVSAFVTLLTVGFVTKSDARDRLRARGAVASGAFSADVSAVTGCANLLDFFVTINGRIGASVGTIFVGIASDERRGALREIDCLSATGAVEAAEFACDAAKAEGGAVNMRDILLALPTSGFEFIASFATNGISVNVGGGDGGRWI